VKKRDLIYHKLGQFYFKTCLYPWLIIGLLVLKWSLKIYIEYLIMLTI